MHGLVTGSRATLLNSARLMGPTLHYESVSTYLMSIWGFAFGRGVDVTKAIFCRNFLSGLQGVAKICKEIKASHEVNQNANVFFFGVPLLQNMLSIFLILRWKYLFVIHMILDTCCFTPKKFGDIHHSYLHSLDIENTF